MDKKLEGLVLDIKNICESRKLTIAVAESCTGGLIGAALTEVPGISAYFLGGVLSYSREAKENLLGVPLSWMQTHGQVSLLVAKSMAEGACVALGSDWAVSVTGVAGPGGGSPEKPVGTVCFGVCGPGFVSYHGVNITGDRQAVRYGATVKALELLKQSMLQ